MDRPQLESAFLLRLQFSQSELAQLLGANRPNVNAALGLLERAGAIGRTIYDTVKLTQIAQGEEA